MIGDSRSLSAEAWVITNWLDEGKRYGFFPSGLISDDFSGI
jgi:hypothetical protein